MVSRAAPQLSEEVLGEIAGRVETPDYDRQRLRPSIVHIGVGAFHRAHQAVYLDDLAHVGAAWGECGVGMLPQDRIMGEALRPQHCLYTLLTRDAEQDRARVIGSLLDYLFAPDQPEAVLAALSSASTHVVTMTITEGGYNIIESTGRFDAANEGVQADLGHLSSPSTVFGYLTEALDRRCRAGIQPFTLLSCDNVQSNGHVTRNALVSFARLRDESLARWIEQHVAFPNSMVDRITPQTTNVERDLLSREFGIADRWPVVSEPFRQWVIEDTFSDGRPAFEEVGVQMVADVLPYENMKLRLLNASHSSMGYLGAVAGYETVDETMADPLFCAFIERQMREEVAPLLSPVPGIDLDAYQRTLIERFSNPRIGDQVARVCLDSSAKVPKFLLPPLHDALAAGRPHRWLTLGLAGWLRYLLGVDDRGQKILVQDARGTELQALAAAGREDPRPLLALRDLFGDLGGREKFVSELQSYLHDLYSNGARPTLARRLEEPGP